MASAGLDLSLDDLIKQRKQASRGARGGGRGRGEGGSRGSGPVRRSNRGAFRSTPYAFKPTPMDIDGQWDHEMFASGTGAPVGPIETGSKLYISNLDFGVSNEDIRTLFSEIGELKRSSVNYDRSGRSKGTAEVVYVRKADAIAAMQKYSNVQLDGKLMKIELIGTNLPIAGIPPAFNPALAAGFARRGGFAMPYRGRGRGTFVGGRGAVRGRGRGGGRGRARETPKSQEELDAELDAYQAQKDKSTEMQV